MSEEDLNILDAMDKYGGSFVKSLAQLARRADRINLLKIKSTWWEYWQQYETMANNEKARKDN